MRKQMKKEKETRTLRSTGISAGCSRPVVRARGARLFTAGDLSPPVPFRWDLRRVAR